MPLPRFSTLDEPRRRAILGAAAEEFGEKGFAAASYNRVIERAGISKGAMYYYFADKDDLFRTLLESAVAQWVVQVMQPFDVKDADGFWATCQTIYERSLRFMLADRTNAAICLCITRSRERREDHAALVELQRQMEHWTNEIIRSGRSVGAVRDDIPPELLLQVALSMMDAGDRWLASRWGEFKPEDVASTAKTMVDLFKRVGAPLHVLTGTDLAATPGRGARKKKDQG
jgi:AcrR family transcriptional regulator